MRPMLQMILQRVIDQQKFAEAKNAILATACGATGLALIAAPTNRTAEVFYSIAQLALGAGSLFFIAATLAFWSFIPRLSNSVKKSRHQTASKNLFFVADLAKLDEHELVVMLGKELGQVREPGKIEIDMANQIIVNAQIASRKYFWFRLSCVFAICGICLLFLMLGLEMFDLRKLSG